MNTNTEMNPTKKATLVWLTLILLSGIAAWAGEFVTLNSQVVLFLVLSLMVKGQLVVDHFMGLRKVSLLWRGIVSAFGVVMGGVILGTLRLG